MAYNLIYGAYEDAVNEGVQPEWRLFTDSAHQNPDKHDLPSSWASDIYLMDPSNSSWQNYINNEMRKTLKFSISMAGIWINSAIVVYFIIIQVKPLSQKIRFSHLSKNPKQPWVNLW
jgi:hypothetical protein